MIKEFDVLNYTIFKNRILFLKIGSYLKKTIFTIISNEKKAKAQ